jgi:FkbM family methyltransferase
MSPARRQALVTRNSPFSSLRRLSVDSTSIAQLADIDQAQPREYPMTQTTIDRADTQSRWTEVRRQGLLWQLDLDRYLDKEIYDHGCFESRTSDIVRQWVRPGMKILDVGANFGYFTTLFADLVGPSGHVWALEPTQKYGRRIHWHVDANGFSDRTTVLNLGLSDCNEQRSIDIVDSSATLHLWEGNDVSGRETISLRCLDDVAAELDLPAVDFIKVDIDGHEPFFLKGAQAYLERHQPALLIEFAWEHLKSAGSDIWGLKKQLEELNYDLYSEATLQRIKTNRLFAAEADNHNQSSVNIWAFPQGRGPEYLPTLAAKRVCEAVTELSNTLSRPAEVWLFGAGQHTFKAMVAKNSWNEFGRVSAIIDDDPRFSSGNRYLGLPVFDRRQAEDKLEHGAKFDAVILSTDTHQDRFFELTARIRARGINVISLYPG